MSFGKVIFGFFIIGICMVATLMIVSQNASTPMGEFNIGNGSVYTDNTSQINQTAQLLGTSTSIGTGAGVAVLLIVGAVVTLGALAFIVRRT
jgi:hypothetical protein